MRPALAILWAALLITEVSEAHKGATSKFTYNQDVYPIFLSRCGGCHIDGGVGPMSLLKYEDAFPWAEALRTEMVAAATGDPHDFVKAAHRQISARELDIMLEWATGGTPEGDKASTPVAPVFKNDWTAGKPGLELPMPEPYELPANTLEGTHEFAVVSEVPSPHTVVQIDLLPGNPSIVRHATLALRSPDGTNRMLGTWVPRQTRAPIGLKPPIRLEPGAQIVARIHYKKTWKFEGDPMTDRSTIGLYFAD